MNLRQTIIVEANTVVRQSLKRMVEEHGFSVVGAFESFSALLDQADLSENITVVLSSSNALGPEQINQVRQIKSLQDSAAVIVMGGRCDFQTAIEAIRSGAHACLDDTTSCEAFFKALDLAGHNVAVVSISKASLSIDQPVEAACAAMPVPHKAKLETRPEPPARIERGVARLFSPREAAILRMLQQGEPNKKIARQLGLTEATVKVHLKSILRKIGASNRTQAAVWAMGYIGTENIDEVAPRIPASFQMRADSSA